MGQVYEWPDKIPDAAIKEEFANATMVRFSAKRFNFIPYRSIAFGDLGWWLPLKRVLPLIGITPQMLRPMFSPQRETVKRRFPFNLKWFGFNKQTYKTIEVELPPMVETYEELGEVRVEGARFVQFAQILGKPVEVLREDGYSGEHYPVFTAYPSGEVVAAED